MEDAVALSSTNNISSYSYMKMMHIKAPSTFSVADHLKSCIPTHKHSRLIAKKKLPEIKIVHIIPPEVIQTDIANFRNLVQSLTGRTSSTSNTRITKLQRPQASSGYQNKNYGLGFSGSSNIKLNPNKRASDDLNHKQLNLDAEYDHEVWITGGFQKSRVCWSNDEPEVRMTKVEEDEMMVEAAVGSKWGMKDEPETGFCSDGFLELGDGFLQEIDFPLMPPVGSNWEIDLFGEF